MMANLTYAVLALVPVSWYIYFQLRQWRFQKYSHIPQHYPQSFLLGHLKLIAEGFKKFGDGRHIDYVIEQLINAKGRPGILFLDLRPANYPMAIITTHDIAEQVTKPTKMHPYSVTKSPTFQMSYRRLVGKFSLISEE
ncbi:hypothetical protein EJ04DRAFT_494787, partial [Polyplosphaeria fusca]